MLYQDLKPVYKWMKIFVIGGLCLFVLTGGVMVYWVTQQAFNAKKIMEAQVKVYEAQAENVGKPQIVEQRYFSPEK